MLSSLPGGHRRVAEQEAARILVVDDGYLRGREPVPMLAIAQRAVTAGRRLQLSYQRGNAVVAGRRTVDPAGLVCAGRTWYLLASHRRQRRTYVVPGELFFASSNDLYSQFDYNDRAEHIIIELSEAHLWDASTIATLDAITDKFHRHGRTVEITELDEHSAARHEQLSGHLGGGH